MKIFLTGGSGDLGQRVIPLLKKEGHTPINFDIREPPSKIGEFNKGSLLNPSQILTAIEGADLVIHIAAWHGIHETHGWKTQQDFLDLNVDGTHNLIAACANHAVSRVIHISSSSVSKANGIYGHTKRMAEEIMSHAHHTLQMDIITLRPRAFIPPDNHTVYSGFNEWAKRFWLGAVHIDDVAQSLINSVRLLESRSRPEHNIFAIDRSPDFPEDALLNWDENGPGSTFNKFYPEYNTVAESLELDTSIQPNYTDISETRKEIGYSPEFSLRTLLDEHLTL